MDLIYGPVSSWRLGRSLGVDLICRENAKICPFDCVYCSLGETTEKTVDRESFVETEEFERAFKELPDDIEADVLTISGTGEPTLARNMGEIIDLARKNLSLPVAVLTNSALMPRSDVREELAGADIVVGSLDASNPDLFEEVNKPHPDVDFEEVVRGMKKFAGKFDGMFSLEVMFVPGSKDFSGEIAEVAREIRPDEVQINTPLRSSPVEPLSPVEIEEVREDFKGLNTRTVYESEKPDVEKIVGENKLERLKRPSQK